MTTKVRKGQAPGQIEPYATSHDTLDKDIPMQQESRNVARAVAHVTAAAREGTLKVEFEALPKTRTK